MRKDRRRLELGFSFLLCLVLLLGQSAVSIAQEEGSRLASGKDLYLTRCASCHGEDGKGNGPAAVVLKNPPADLTQISKKNGGTFPTTKVMGFIDGERPVPAHGPRHMPVWGEVFREGRPDSEARMRILSLTSYLESIQEK